MGTSSKKQQPTVIESLAKYVEFISAQYTDDIVLFRGQRTDWPLEPKIARIKNVPDLFIAEKDIINDFKRQSIPYLEYEPQSDLEWMAIGQHYGLPTRLLDWTVNSLTAMWFAVEKPPIENKIGVVWVFSPPQEDIVSPDTIKDPFSPRLNLVFRPRYITKRIEVQGGWFTITKYFTEKRRFHTLNTVARLKQRFEKIVIPHDKFASIRKDLLRCGFQASSIYLGLEGICTSITQKYFPVENISQPVEAKLEKSE